MRFEVRTAKRTTETRRLWVQRCASGALVFAVTLLVAGEAPALFEDLPVSPRARALGEATTTTMDDAWAYYYNPAMLTLVGFPQVGATTAQPNGLNFNRLTSVAAAAPLRGNRGTLAFGWRRYAVEFRDVDLVSENTLSVGHGFRLLEDGTTTAALGWTLNLYHADMATYSKPGGTLLLPSRTSIFLLHPPSRYPHRQSQSCRKTRRRSVQKRSCFSETRGRGTSGGFRQSPSRAGSPNRDCRSGCR